MKRKLILLIALLSFSENIFSGGFFKGSLSKGFRFAVVSTVSAFITACWQRQDTLTAPQAVPQEAPFYASTATQVLGDKESMYPELARFLNKYGCFEEVEKEKENFMPCVVKYGVYETPNYYIKTDTDRVLNAIRMQNYLDQIGKSDIGVAKKCLTRDMLVVAQRVDADIDKYNATYEEKEETYQKRKYIEEDLGYGDGHFCNFRLQKIQSSKESIHTSSAHTPLLKMVIIDTESASFIYLNGVKKMDEYDTKGIDFKAVSQQIVDFKETKDYDLSFRVLLDMYGWGRLCREGFRFNH